MKSMPAVVVEAIRALQPREIECVIPDLNGLPRGKALPAEAFLAGQELRMARAIAIYTATGDFPDVKYTGESDPDMQLKPDYATLRPVPWARTPRMLAIHDCVDLDGKETPIASRQVLKNVLRQYAAHGLQPIVAPELEFYLFALNPDPNQPFSLPLTREGRQEQGASAFTFHALNAFDGFFDELYQALPLLGIRSDTFVHELGPGQFEINLLHGNALDLADQTFLFKYALREIGLKHNLNVVFMAKPLAGAAGSSMHLHQSVIDTTGHNVFSLPDGQPSALFFHFIAGLQQCLPDLMPMLCPSVNSYRRFVRYMTAPVNFAWSYDNRSAGLRIPLSHPAARRVENRLPGSDANPYLALAASLAAGLYGMLNQLMPTPAAEGDIYRDAQNDGRLARSLDMALIRMAEQKTAERLFGSAFTSAFIAAKQVELDAFLSEITPWERRYLI